MAGGGRDVNAIWEQLRQQSAAPRRGGGLSGLAGLPGVTSRVRTIDKNAAAQPTARPSFIAQLGQGPKSDGAQQQAGGDHQALLVSAAAACAAAAACSLTAAC